jgi:NAD kinase
MQFAMPLLVYIAWTCSQSHTHPEIDFLDTFSPDEARKLHEAVDFVTCLGGDGLVLHASSIFQGAIPPVRAVLFGVVVLMTLFFMLSLLLKIVIASFSNIMISLSAVS